MKLNRVQIFYEAVSIPLFVGHGFCHIFGLGASFGLRFSRKVYFCVDKLHYKFREVWSFGLGIIENLVYGC